MNNSFFNPTADKIFLQAGVSKEMAPEMYEEVINILASKMAMLSATMGLSYKRLDAFSLQEQTLVDDLIKLRAEGHLR